VCAYVYLFFFCKKENVCKCTYDPSEHFVLLQGCRGDGDDDYGEDDGCGDGDGDGDDTVEGDGATTV
jgi:hypothetical protein